MIGVDIFSGVGGMSLGTSMAGVNVKFAVEIDRYAAETFMANHKGVTMLNDDIQNIHIVPLNKTKDTTILFGGPPCQGLSYSN
jgi:DNA (cytosine-5)-methyltransferase 1